MSKRTNYISWDTYFMRIAETSAQRSKDPSTQVRACIVNSRQRIIGIGYNGFPMGVSDDEISWNREGAWLDSKYPFVCHAEMNAIIEETGVPQGFTVRTFGNGTLNEDFTHLSEETLQRGEAIGIAIALIILIVVFGAVVAAVVPILLAIVAIIVAFGLTALIGQVLELSFFVTNVITMIGRAAKRRDRLAAPPPAGLAATSG